MQAAAATILPAIEEHEISPVQALQHVPNRLEVLEVQLLVLAAPPVLGQKQEVRAVHAELVEHEKVRPIHVGDLVSGNVDVASRHVTGAPLYRRTGSRGLVGVVLDERLLANGRSDGELVLDRNLVGGPKSMCT